MEEILKYLVKNGVTDETCNNYHADVTKKCDSLFRCKDCNHSGCFSTDYY